LYSRGRRSRGRLMRPCNTMPQRRHSRDHAAMTCIWSAMRGGAVPGRTKSAICRRQGQSGPPLCLLCVTEARPGGASPPAGHQPRPALALALLAPPADAGDLAFIVPAPLRSQRTEDARREWPPAPACAGLRRARNGAPLRAFLRSPIRPRSGVADMGRPLVTRARAPGTQRPYPRLALRPAPPGVSALPGSPLPAAP